MAATHRLLRRGVGPHPRSALPALLLAAVIALTVLAIAAAPAHAQNYQIIYTFSGCADGDSPSSTLTLDRSGRLYGTATWGGDNCAPYGHGVVFRLERAGSGWIETPIHTFQGSPDDGGEPFDWSGMTVGPDGLFYGTTDSGGAEGNGTVFTVQPSATACTSALCTWPSTVLYSFGSPGIYGLYSNVALDSAGNVYGTTVIRNGASDGTVFELTDSGGTWTLDTVHAWTDNTYPDAGLLIDSAGNLWGTNFNSGLGGSVFEITRSGSGWAFNTLHSFNGHDGDGPVGTLVMDAAGNVYGTTSKGGTGDPAGGTVFELSPSNGGFTFTTLCNFTGDYGSLSALAFDAAGNLYGTTAADGAFHQGSVFMVTHNGSGWTCTDLHDFSGGADGQEPTGGVALDSSGNLYGTTSGSDLYGGGQVDGSGTVWKITP